MFSPEHFWTAAKLPGKPERNCPPGLAGTEGFGYNWWIRHFQHDSATFPPSLGDEVVSHPALQSRRKQLSVTQSWKPQKQRGCQGSHRAPVPWLQLCLVWSRDTALRQPLPGAHANSARACQAELQHLAPNISGVSPISLCVHSTWAPLPLSPARTTLPQPCRHDFIVLHMRKGKTSLNASSTPHCCSQNLLSLFFLSNWILICPVWDSHRADRVLHAQLLAEYLPLY